LPIIVDDSVDVAEAHTLSIGINHHEALLGKAESGAPLLPMSGSGKALDSTNGICFPGILVLSLEPTNPLAFTCKVLSELLFGLTLICRFRCKIRIPNFRQLR
jgi:hypothetical protein